MGSIVPPLIVGAAAYILGLLTTTGDILIRGVSGVTRLAIGSTHHVLTVAGGVPTWAAGSKATLTTTGDVLYASAANTLARLGVGSEFDSVTVDGGVPAYHRVGRPRAGFFTGGQSSATVYGFSNGINTFGATSTDNSSAALNAYGHRFFQQDTSAVANNTAYSYMTTASGPGWTSRPLITFLFATPTTADAYFVVQYSTAGSATATATELTQSIGVSFLSGDTNWTAFSRAAGAAERTALTGGTTSPPVTGKVYALIIDAYNFPASVIVSLYNVTDGVWIGSATLSSSLPAAADAGTLHSAIQTIGGVRSIYQGGLTVDPQGIPNRSAP